MKIAVYCASRLGNEPAFAEGAKALGLAIGSLGHTLVYGGSNSGLMGIVADATLAAGGQVIGVIPRIPEIMSRIHPGLSEYHYTESLGDRKLKMIELADAYVALPGGVGTLDELTDIVSLARLKVNLKPCVLYNIKDFYAPIKVFFDDMVRVGFVQADEFESLLISGDLSAMMAFIERFQRI